ncbi:MAG: hypothetical protein ACRD2D_13915 [Terriglobales bacterium]
MWAKSPPPQAAPPSTRDLLLQTAKAALPNVPDEIAVMYRVELGRAEAMRAAPGRSQAGLDDLARAFDQAVQMPAGHDDSPESKLRGLIKDHAEQEAVVFTATVDARQALALIRRADIPRANLYDQVLYDVAIMARHKHKVADLDPMTIVRECQRNGSFPYRGVTQIINNDLVPVEQRLALARMELQYAQGDDLNDHYELLNAPGALTPMHGVFPQLDAQIVDADTNILRQFDKIANGGKMAAGSARRQGTFLLAALRQIDGSRAAELASQYPEFVATSDLAASSPALFGALHDRQTAAAEELPPLPADTADAAARFAANAQRAAILAKKDPAQALDDAHRAVALATADLLSESGMPETAFHLAMTLKGLHDARDADDLLGRALDALAASDAAREKAYREGDETAVLQFVMKQAGARSGATWAALLVADQVDFEITARHVLAWPEPITRVAALIAAAWGDAPQPNSSRPSRY